MIIPTIDYVHDSHRLRCLLCPVRRATRLWCVRLPVLVDLGNRVWTPHSDGRMPSIGSAAPPQIGCAPCTAPAAKLDVQVQCGSNTPPLQLHQGGELPQRPAYPSTFVFAQTRLPLPVVFGSCDTAGHKQAA